MLGDDFYSAYHCELHAAVEQILYEVLSGDVAGRVTGIHAPLCHLQNCLTNIK